MTDLLDDVIAKIKFEPLTRAEQYAQLRRLADVVPGRMHCAKCKFVLTRVNLYVNHGTTGAGGNETEPCPNGCGPLWPVTWEQEARSGYEALEAMFDRMKIAEDRVAELERPPVRLKRGTTGVCGRTTTGCVCERNGLGDECIWLQPVLKEAQ